jgi:hypothetical protein
MGGTPRILSARAVKIRPRLCHFGNCEFGTPEGSDHLPKSCARLGRSVLQNVSALLGERLPGDNVSRPALGGPTEWGARSLGRSAFLTKIMGVDSFYDALAVEGPHGAREQIDAAALFLQLAFDNQG